MQEEKIKLPISVIKLPISKIRSIKSTCLAIHKEVITLYRQCRFGLHQERSISDQSFVEPWCGLSLKLMSSVSSSLKIRWHLGVTHWSLHPQHKDPFQALGALPLSRLTRNSCSLMGQKRTGGEWCGLYN